MNEPSSSSDLHRLFAHEARLAVERREDPSEGLRVLQTLPEYQVLTSEERASVDAAYRRAAGALLWSAQRR